MTIIYTSDNETPMRMQLETLFAHFRTSKTEHWENDIRDDLESRGWYEGVHDGGRYIIINIEKFEGLWR